MFSSLPRRFLRKFCCRSIEIFLFQCVNRISASLPVPSDYEPIASIFYYSGFHNHREFHLLVEVNAIEGAFLKKQIVVELVTGGSRCLISAIPKTDKGSIENLGSRGALRIRQCDSTLQIIVHRKHTFTKSAISTLNLMVERDILHQNSPKNRWYTLQNGKKKIGRIKLSLYQINVCRSLIDCMVLQQALLTVQEYVARGTDIKINIENPDVLPEHEKLMLFSFSLEGNLVEKDGYVSQMRYFKATILDEKWHWLYWNSKSEYLKRLKPEGSILILGISTVLRHPTDFSSFYVKYYSRDGAKDLIFKAIDRTRDIWTDSLYLFIEQARRYVERYGNFSALNEYVVS